MTANVNDLLETKKNEPALRAWVKEVAKRTKPQRVVWCNGTKKEYLQLVKQMLTEESLIQLKSKAVYAYPSEHYEYWKEKLHNARQNQHT